MLRWRQVHNLTPRGKELQHRIPLRSHNPAVYFVSPGRCVGGTCFSIKMTAITDNLDGANADDLHFLLDGARGVPQEVFKDVEAQRMIASDSGRPLRERLEAFEDIFDSEVGDTSMVRARNIERSEGLRQLYLKFEGGNPTGTQKDRIAFSQTMDAMRRGFDGMSVATCGNYGVAMALSSSLAGLTCVVHVPVVYHTRRVQEMRDLGAEIIRVEGDYEHAVEVSKAYAAKHEIYDANPGGSNTMLQLFAYEEIAYEIYDELRDAPFVVAVPVSNGTTLAGIYKGFVSLYRRGRTSRMPRIVAGSSAGKNPIVQSFASGSAVCIDLKPERVRETPTNEPLINWHSSEGNLALTAVRQTDGWAGNASDKNMQSYARAIREKEGLNVLPASMAGLIALLDHHHREPLPRDRYVAVLTGRR